VGDKALVRLTADPLDPAQALAFSFIWVFQR